MCPFLSSIVLSLFPFFSSLWAFFQAARVVVVQLVLNRFPRFKVVCCFVCCAHVPSLWFAGSLLFVLVSLIFCWESGSIPLCLMHIRFDATRVVSTGWVCRLSVIVLPLRGRGGGTSCLNIDIKENGVWRIKMSSKLMHSNCWVELVKMTIVVECTLHSDQSNKTKTTFMNTSVPCTKCFPEYLFPRSQWWERKRALGTTPCGVSLLQVSKI